MKFKDMIQESLNDKTKVTSIDTVKDSIKIVSFIEETDEYLKVATRMDIYLIPKDKIVSFKSRTKVEPFK